MVLTCQIIQKHSMIRIIDRISKQISLPRLRTDLASAIATGYRPIGLPDNNCGLFVAGDEKTHRDTRRLPVFTRSDLPYTGATALVLEPNNRR